MCFYVAAAKSARVEESASAMDTSGLQSCLVDVHSLDPEEKLLALGSAWNGMSPESRVSFLKEIRRAERVEDVDDFTLLQIAAVESPEFSKTPIGCFTTAVKVFCAFCFFRSICRSLCDP